MGNELNSTSPLTDASEQSFENNALVSQENNNANFQFSVASMFTTTPLLPQTKNSIAGLNVNTSTTAALSSNPQSNNSNKSLSFQISLSDLTTLPTSEKESQSSTVLLSTERYPSISSFDVNASADNISLVSQAFAKNFTPSNNLSYVNTDESNPGKTNFSKHQTLIFLFMEKRFLLL